MMLSRRRNFQNHQRKCILSRGNGFTLVIIIAAAEDILKVSASREKKHFQNDNFQSIDCTVFYDDSCEFTL